MKDIWYSAEQIAQMLGLHPKTVRRYITEGKLRANKLGKQYRVSGHDLSLFTGNADFPAKEEPFVPRAEVSAVIDLNVRGREDADRAEAALFAAVNAKDPSYGDSSLNVQRFEGDKRIRIMLWGTPQFAAALLESVAVLNERMKENE